MKIFAADIIILQMCTKNHNHMTYGSWDMECHRQKFLSLWTIFCLFTPLWTQKIKILKKWKNHLKILLFYKYLLHMTVIWHMVFQIWNATDKIFCHFGPFFCPFALLNNPENQNFEKLEKALGAIIISRKCTKNDDHMLYCSLDMACNWFNYFSFWAIFYP